MKSLVGVGVRMKERLYIQIVQREKERANDNMRRPPSTSERVRVFTMREGETMEETMKREQAEAIATLMKANRAFDRIFGIQEEEEE